MESLCHTTTETNPWNKAQLFATFTLVPMTGVQGQTLSWISPLDGFSSYLSLGSRFPLALVLRSDFPFFPVSWSWPRSVQGCHSLHFLSLMPWFPWLPWASVKVSKSSLNAGWHSVPALLEHFESLCLSLEGPL